MSQLKNALLVALAAALIAETGYLKHQAAATQAEVTDLRRQNDDWKSRYRKAAARQRDPSERVTVSPGPLATEATAAPFDSMEQHMAEVLKRARELKAWIDRHPEQKIGELTYLKDADWTWLAEERLQNLTTEDDYRKAAAQLRERAEQEFMSGPMEDAMKAYLKANGNVLPTDIGAIASFLGSSYDPSLLQHYAMIASGSPISGIPFFANNPTTSVVDEKYDTTLVAVGPGGMWSRGGSNLPLQFDAMQASNAYRAANNGQQPPTQELLVPYFKNPALGAEFLGNLRKQR